MVLFIFRLFFLAHNEEVLKMARERYKLKIWAVSLTEQYGKDFDTMVFEETPRYKFYKNKEDAYKFVLGCVLRSYAIYTSSYQMMFGRPIVKYYKGDRGDTDWFYFVIKVPGDDDLDDYMEKVYKVVTEKVY